MISFAFIQQGGGGILPTLINFAPFLLIFGVFYFLVILPQRKRQQALQTLISELKAGDRVVTSGGIIATITAVRDDSLIVRSADKSMLEISRGSVAGLHGGLEKKQP